LQGIGGFLKETVGTVPEDLVGLLGGDWLKVRRAENIARMIKKAKDRQKARKTEHLEQPSISIAVPLLVAAADESRDELQEIWARLLAAATDPARAQSFRLRYIAVAKELDPLRCGSIAARGRASQWRYNGRHTQRNSPGAWCYAGRSGCFDRQLKRFAFGRYGSSAGWRNHAS